MYDYRRFFIGGAWTRPDRPELDVINPATEEPVGKILMGNAADVDAAVRAARGAFESYGESSKDERIALLERIIRVYERRLDDVARAISDEMGAPTKFARRARSI